MLEHVEGNGFVLHLRIAHLSVQRKEKRRKMGGVEGEERGGKERVKKERVKKEREGEAVAVEQSKYNVVNKAREYYVIMSGRLTQHRAFKTEHTDRVGWMECSSGKR